MRSRSALVSRRRRVTRSTSSAIRAASAASRSGTCGAAPTAASKRDEARELADIADAGEHDAEDAGLLHDGDHLGRTRRHDQPAHLVADALARQRAQAVAGADRRRQPAGIDGAVAVFGAEAQEAQDAQPVLGDPLVGVADEADAAREDIGIAADRIVHRAVGIDRQRVDGEVAPHGVGRPVAAEAHHRMAAVGLDVLAQRRHLVAAPVDDDGQRAVVDAGGHAS